MMWNKNDWQGRSKSQVDRNNRVFTYSIIISVIGIIILLIKTILK